MDKGHKETISIRFVSTAFMVLAITIFKPFGLEMSQWQAYVHLLALFALGMSSCFLSEAILKFIVRCHRAFLVNLGQVEQIISLSGSTQLLINHCHESLPVSRSNMAQVRAAIQRGS